jgi:hypothetical protein
LILRIEGTARFANPGPLASSDASVIILGANITHLAAPAAVPRKPRLIADRANGTTEANGTHASAGLLEQRT